MTTYTLSAVPPIYLSFSQSYCKQV